MIDTDGWVFPKELQGSCRVCPELVSSREMVSCPYGYSQFPSHMHCPVLNAKLKGEGSE